MKVNLDNENRSSEEVNATPLRSEIESKYKWNLGDIYPASNDFDKDVKLIRELIKSFSAFRGTLTDEKNIKIALDRYYSLAQKIDRARVYAHRFFDQDTRDSAGIEMKMIADNLEVDFNAASSFLNPELLALPKEILESLAKNPDFKDYRMPIIDLSRHKDHVLSGNEEAILAQSSIIKNSGYNIFGTFIDGELQFPEITLFDGKKVALTRTLFTNHRKSPNRGDRKLVFDNFFGALNNYRNTLARTLSSQVDACIFNAKARKFESAAQAALFSENIPLSVYDKIIQEVNDNLPVLHRYIRLKKKILGVDIMKYYDLYAPISGSVKENFTYEQASGIILDALKPMGEDYSRIASMVIKPGSGWIDAYPNRGKSSGAYSDSIYGLHSYILMNFSGSYGSVSTYIHELGHTMHSYLSGLAQPYSQSNYTIFTAEIASTFNENLLLESRLSQENDKTKKIALLGEFLEKMRASIFRQALFAEFEYKIYEAAENNTSLTADFLNRTYLDLVKKYYGHDKGIVDVDDIVAIEWANIPHFYKNFYVYKYVSGDLVGLALSQKVLNGDNVFRDAYIEKVLKDGGSRYPLEQLKDVGIDMMDSAMYEEAFAVFQEKISQLEMLTDN